MLKVAMLALGASLTVGAIAPQHADAQLSGRTRTTGQTVPTDRRGDVIVHQDGRVYNDNRCYDDRYERRGDRDDDDRWEGRNDDRPNRPHDNGKHKGWYKKAKHGKDDCNDRNGSAYCRDNNGRVVRDIEWCRETGRRISYEDRGTVGNIGDIILRRPRDGAQRVLSYGTLQQVLGSGVLSRIDQQRYQLGYNGNLTGRWYDASSGSELDLFAGGLQIAQLLDRNRDGRVDVVRWTNGR